jgi:hypothetical protein
VLTSAQARIPSRHYLGRDRDTTVSDSHAAYSLFDTETGNLVGSYGLEEAALQDVVDTVREYGVRSPEVLSLSLVRHGAPRGQSLIAEGATLASRAMSMISRQRRAHEGAPQSFVACRIM